MQPAVQTPTCELDAALNAIDKTGIVLAVCAGEQPRDKAFAAALRYAQRTGRNVQCISLCRRPWQRPEWEYRNVQGVAGMWTNGNQKGSESKLFNNKRRKNREKDQSIAGKK